MISVEQLIGSTLGEYQVERLLGHGELSSVYLGQHKAQGQVVTITTFNFPGGIAAPAREHFRERFAREGAVLVRLNHPNILPICAYGERAGHPYLITAFVKAASLARVLKQQVRFTPQQVLSMLKQVAAALDYAHSNGVVHTTLSLTNILAIDSHTMQIAGFGLKTLLELHGTAQVRQQPAHLLSASGQFLGSPDCISPEQVLGTPGDARADIYAVGVMLFEQLSGVRPFSGADPLAIALKRIQQQSPSLHALCPELPESLELIVNKALASNPAQRYQQVGEIAVAFEHVLQVLEVAQQAPATRSPQMTQDAQITLPPTVNWFDEEMLSPGTAQFVFPSPTDPTPSAMAETSVQSTSAAGTSSSIAGVDPFALWAATEASQPGTLTRQPLVRAGKGSSHPQCRPGQMGRRQLVRLIVAGTATAGVLAIGGLSFAHFEQSLKQSRSQQAAKAPGSWSVQATQGRTPGVAPTKSSQKTPTAAKSPTARPSPTQGPHPSPTAQSTPNPKPTAPPHTGTVIGHTNQPVNSASSFSNPTDGQGSLLIRLPNGNFVACERACTHAGVPVNYDSGSYQLVCPAHGAIFDPQNGFSHTSGPGNGPLSTVAIRVNSDGTITTG